MELSSFKIEKRLIFWEIELSSPKIKKFLYFLKKAFLIFLEMELFKKNFTSL